MLHQAAEVGELFGARLELIVFVAFAAMMGERLGKEFRPAEAIEIALVEVAHLQCRQRLHDPARMRSTAGDVDHRQAGAGAKIRSEHATRDRTFVLQAGCFRRVRLRGVDAAIGGAGADGDAVVGKRRQLTDPGKHGAAGAGEPVIETGAVRPAQDRAFDAEEIERRASGRDIPEDGEGLLPALLAEGRMPEEIDTEILQLAHPAARAVVEHRHGAATAASSLQPQEIGHSDAPSCSLAIRHV